MTEGSSASIVPITFHIDTEVAPAYLDGLLKFIHRYYILPDQRRFTNVKQMVVDHECVLHFTVLGPKGSSISVEIRGKTPIEVRMTPSDARVPQEALNLLKEDLIIMVQLFEEKVRKTTLYFAWVEGAEMTSERVPTMWKKIISKIFLGNMLFLFVLFVAINILVFMILGMYAPILIVFLQFILILLSDRIIMKMGDWVITEENPNVHLLQYHLSVEEYKELLKTYSKDVLLKIKREIYQQTLAQGRKLNCQTAQGVFSNYGFRCVPENLSTKTVHVYRLVKEAVDRFRLPMPKIVVLNTILPNAAATGPDPRRGTVLITTGLLVQLEEDEILSVLGHELSHIKGRDPLVLFALTSGEYLLRVYFFWPFIALFGFLYLMLALGVIYFIAKFFEARADLESATRIGNPKALAEALRKIGFHRLQFERIPAYRLQEWMSWNPHPPLYFRIARLESLSVPVKIKHIFIQSIRDCINGFLTVF